MGFILSSQFLKLDEFFVHGVDAYDAGHHVDLMDVPEGIDASGIDVSISSQEIRAERIQPEFRGGLRLHPSPHGSSDCEWRIIRMRTYLL